MQNKLFGVYLFPLATRIKNFLLPFSTSSLSTNYHHGSFPKKIIVFPLSTLSFQASLKSLIYG